MVFDFVIIYLGRDDEFDLVFIDESVPYGGRKLFADFCNSEFSIENLSCYEDLLLFREEKSLEKKKEIFEIIFYKYFNGSESELEVNISGGAKNDLNNIFKSMDTIIVFDDSVILKLIGDLKLNLIDTFSRFKLTKSYFNWNLNKQDSFMK
jgi:hypothetical protein